MAKAKKKLNTNFLIVVASVTAAIGVIGVGGGYMLYRSKRPDQLKDEGRELMLKGEYTDAFNRFSRAGNRKTTDPEFLTWMQEAETHLTSFDPLHYRASLGLLDAIIAASPDKVPPTLKKVQAYLTDIESNGIDQYPADLSRDLESGAKLILEREPKSPVALRMRAYLKIMPLFAPGAVTTSAEALTVLEDVKAILEINPDEPDLSIRYAQALLKHREAQIREMSISDSPSSEQAKATYAELRRLSDRLLDVGKNEALPVEERARAYLRNFELLQLAWMSQLTPREDIETLVMGRMSEVIGKASSLVTPGGELFLKTRLSYAMFLSSPLLNKVKEAETVLRETVEQTPKQWRARLELANALHKGGKSQEAVEVLSVEQAADYSLTGISGLMFYYDRERVPLRRAYFRLQTIAGLPPEARDAEIKKIESDYNAAVSSSRVGEADPYARQVQAGLQEIRQDRTGALATIAQARSRLSDGPEARALLLSLYEQELRILLSLSQTGRAEEVAEQLLRLEPTNLVHHLQLIDLKIRNGFPDQAKALIDRARTAWPDQPALAALEIRLLPDEASKLKAFERIPEDSRQRVEVKMKFASDAGLEGLVAEIAERFLKDNPDDYRVTLMYVQSLLKQNKREDALRRLNALKAKDPSDANIDRAIAVAMANSPQELQKIWEDETSKASPINKVLIEAQQALGKGDVEGYLAKMREAEKLDTSGIGLVTERIYYFYMAQGKLDEAEAELNKLEKLKRDPAEIRTNRLRITLARATIRQSEGKTDEANKLFEQATNDANALAAEMPNFSGAWIVKALALNARGQAVEAYKAFQTALEAQPDNVEALRYTIELAQALDLGEDMKRTIEAGKRAHPNDPYFDEAKLSYEVSFGDPSIAIEPRIKQRDAQPDNTNTWRKLGETYVTAAKKSTDQAAIADYRKKAIETFTEAKEKFKDSPGFGLYAAATMIEAGDRPGAEKMIESLYNDPVAMANPAFLAALSNYYIEQKQADRALEVMQKLLDTGKADENRLRGQMAQLYAEMGRTDEAMAAADRLPDSPESRQLRINLLLSSRKTEEANKLANSFLEKQKDTTNLMMAAHTEGVVGNVARSVDLANQAVAMDPQNPATRLLRAKVMMRERPLRNNEILEDLDAVKKAAPGNIEARVLMSERLEAMGRSDEAVSELESVVRDLPGNREATRRLIEAYRKLRPIPFNRIDAIFAELRKSGSLDAQMLSLETSVALQKGDIDGAVKSATEASKAAPGDVAMYRQLVDVMVRKGAYREVLGDLDRIQKSNQNVYWTYMMRGLVLHRLKNEADAAKEWDKALSMTMALRDERPTGEVVEKYAGEYGAEATGKWLGTKMGQDVKMRALMLGLYASENQFAKVIELSQQVLPNMKTELSPLAQAMVLRNVGNAYLANTPSNPGKARLVFEELAKLDTESVDVLNNLAYAMMLEGTDIPAAAKIAERAYALTVKSGSPNAAVADTYGWALVQSGKIQEGIDVLREAGAIQQIPDVAYHLGEAYILERQKDAAQQSLQNALDLVQRMSQNNPAVYADLERRIKDAIARANAMEVQ